DDHVHQTAKQQVSDAAKVAEQAACKCSENERKYGCEHGDLQVYACRPDNTGEQVSAKIVGPEWVDEARWSQDAAIIECQRIVGRNPAWRNGAQGQDQKYCQSDYQREGRPIRGPCATATPMGRRTDCDIAHASMRGSSAACNASV